MTNRDYYIHANSRDRAALTRRRDAECSQLATCDDCRHGLLHSARRFADCTASWLAAPYGQPLAVAAIWFLPESPEDPNPL